jgi:hypothetical protein|tara:strand:+ start:197 stop:421 length:225 start_codon:yes stop_codon:yes gene_type:complete
MEHAKAKKAKGKAEKALTQMMMEAEMIKAGEPDLQPADGYVTPMHRIGVVPSSTYSLANMLDGYTARADENFIA